MRTMSNEHEEATIALGNRISEALQASMNYFSMMTENPRESGRIAVTLRSECGIHVLAFVEAATHAHRGLTAWCVKNHLVQLSEIDQLQWKLASQSVELLVRAIEIDRTQEYIALCKEITSSLGRLVGTVFPPLGILKQTVELTEKIAQIRTLAGTDLAAFKDTGKLLTRWELYMMRGLLASQYALVHVDSMLKPFSDSDFQISLAELANQAMLKAKQFVTGSIWKHRQQTGGKELGIRFPEGGMWPAE